MYEKDLTSSDLSPFAVRRTRQEKKKEGAESEEDSYILTNQARVNVFLDTATVTSHKRSELFGPADFVSSVGGLLGLFLGVSAVSLVELFYYLAGMNAENGRPRSRGRAVASASGNIGDKARF